MQVSADSWHYKFLRKKLPRYRSVPSNLCPYMRLLVWKMFLALVLGCAFAVGTVVLASFTFAPLLAIANLAFDFLPAAWLVMPEQGQSMPLFLFALMVGMVAYSIGLVFVAGLCFRDAVEKFRHRRYAKMRNAVPTEPKPPSVFSQWLKDVHDKTCTPIEFVGLPECNVASDNDRWY